MTDLDQAVAAYTAIFDAAAAQNRRLRPLPPEADRWGGARARMFRADPRRPLDATLAAVAEYVGPEDVLIDVGGGAGRVGLPLALRSRELINVEPSPGMSEQFLDSAQEAGIGNVRAVTSEWLAAPDVTGDVVLAVHVTYFVREIVPFVEKLVRSARRRVVLFLGTPPPPTQSAALFELAFGEPEAPPPGHTQLLPVLWAMGSLPDVRVLGDMPPLGRTLSATREEAIEAALAGLNVQSPPASARDVIEREFDRLYTATPEGFRPTWRPRIRQLIVTWETGG